MESGMLPGIARRLCSSRLERRARGDGYRLIAGLDEAGRGCLFGPVYAAAVVLNPDKPVRGLDDSKQLEPERRETLARRIRERALAWAVASADSSEIDRINIYQASRLAMRRAVEALCPQPDYLLVDALKLDTAIAQRSVIHGDALSHSIAAASILAKVTRDENMRAWDRMYPEFGLASHKGYSTPEHIRALTGHGPTKYHRFSFEPVRIAAGMEPVGDTQMALFAEAGGD
jgi:ribonuclease HII